MNIQTKILRIRNAPAMAADISCKFNRTGINQVIVNIGKRKFHFILCSTVFRFVSSFVIINSFENGFHLNRYTTKKCN